MLNGQILGWTEMCRTRILTNIPHHVLLIYARKTYFYKCLCNLTLNSIVKSRTSDLWDKFSVYFGRSLCHHFLVKQTQLVSGEERRHSVSSVFNLKYPATLLKLAGFLPPLCVSVSSCLCFWVIAHPARLHTWTWPLLTCAAVATLLISSSSFYLGPVLRSRWNIPRKCSSDLASVNLTSLITLGGPTTLDISSVSQHRFV